MAASCTALVCTEYWYEWDAKMQWNVQDIKQDYYKILLHKIYLHYFILIRFPEYKAELPITYLSLRPP